MGRRSDRDRRAMPLLVDSVMEAGGVNRYVVKELVAKTGGLKVISEARPAKAY